MQFEDWGLIEYTEAHKKQKELVELRRHNKISDLYIFCHHPPVITVGRGKEREKDLGFIAPPNIPVVPIERGGLATYHGPGQLICYPIVRLAPKKEASFAGVVDYIRFLEEAMICYFKTLNLETERSCGNTGVWINGSRKIASIGIAVSHWIAYHGLALNIKTDKKVWNCFNPCGFSGSVMTDLFSETQKEFSYSDVKEGLIQSFLSLKEHTENIAPQDKTATQCT